MILAQASGLAVDWPIVKDIVEGIMFIGMVMGAYFGLRNEVKIVKIDLGHLADTFKLETKNQNQKIDSQSETLAKLSEVLGFQRLIEERMNNMDKRFSERMSTIQRDIYDIRTRRGLIVEGPQPDREIQ